MLIAERPDYLAHLNAEQRTAACHGIAGAGSDAQGPLLVIAGAGSGKTNTLAHRVACLVANGADPSRLLLLTFSRRAAIEMTRRVEGIVASLGGPLGRNAAGALHWSGTFHGIGARLLREYAERIGLAPSFTIHDREDSADLMSMARNQLGFSSSIKRFPLKGTCLAIYSKVVNTQRSVAVVLAGVFPWCAAWEEELKRLFAAYVEAKQQQSVLDYDDLLLYWSAMMRDPAIAAEVGGRFEHVLVDEYQDTNRLQADVLLALKPDGRGLTVVGDDAQSIYSFRGATVRNILDFPAAFDPPARIVKLERNYRSTQPILAASNAVIGLAAERFSKNLHSERLSSEGPLLVSVADEADQARYVVDQVLEKREAGVLLKQQAVLFRSSNHSTLLELELGRRNVPYVKFGGLKFLEAAHVKDMLACLRWAQNPADRVAGFRVLLMLPGVGPKTATRALDHAFGKPDFIGALADFDVPAAALTGWSELLVLLRQLASGGASAWPGEVAAVRQWYEPHLWRLHENAEVRLADLIELEQLAGAYASRERFLTELTLDPPDATSDKAGAPLLDEDYLILSTIHSAKGQEWSAVTILSAVDGCLPSDLGVGSSEEVEEERRLLYVGMTRAKDHLTLMVPQKFHVHQQSAGGDRHVYASRTRFVPRELESLFEKMVWPTLAPAPALARSRGPSIDVVAQMRGMWR